MVESKEPESTAVGSVASTNQTDLTKTSGYQETKSLALEVEYDYVTVPPDGGYGWIIVVASFFSNMLVDGTVFGFGMLFAPLRDSIANSGHGCIEANRIAPWIPALVAAFYFAAGPFVSTIANRYGFRIVAVIGGIVAAIGFILAWGINYSHGSFKMTEEWNNANSTMKMIICDEKNPPKMNSTNYKSDVSSLFLCCGVIGGFGCGMVYLPAVVATGFYFDKRIALACGFSLCGSGVGTAVFPELIDMILETYNWPGVLVFFACSMLLSSLVGLLYLPLRPRKVARDKYHEDFIVSPSFHGAIGMKVIHLNDETEAAPDNPDTDDGNLVVLKTASVESVGQIPGGSRFAQAYGAIGGRRGSTEGATMTWRAMSGPIPTLETVPVTAGDDKTSTVVPAEKKDSKCQAICKEIIDFSLIHSPTFIVWVLSCFVSMLGVFVPFVYIDQTAEENIQEGYEEVKGKTLLTTIGVGNIFGRIAGGIICNFPKVNILFVSNFFLTTMGISQILVPLLRKKTWTFYLFSIVYGTAMGGVNALIPVLLTELLGIEHLSAAFGLTTFGLAFGVLIGTPIPGLIKDSTSIDAGFIIAGVFLAISAVMLYPIHCIRKWEIRKAERKLAALNPPDADAEPAKSANPSIAGEK